MVEYEQVNWESHELEVDAGDELKFDPIPRGEYAATIYRVTSGYSKKKDPQMKLDIRIVSNNPEYNNTCIYNWFTFSPGAINIARQNIRGVLGSEKLEHGAKITGSEFVELVKEMQYASWPNDNPDTGELREILVYVDHRENPQYGVQNTIKSMKCMLDGWEEPVRSVSEFKQRASSAYDDLEPI